MNRGFGLIAIVGAAAWLACESAPVRLPAATPGSAQVVAEHELDLFNRGLLLELPSGRRVLLTKAAAVHAGSRVRFEVEWQSVERDLDGAPALQEASDVWAYVQGRAELSSATFVTFTFQSPAEPDADSEQCTSCEGDPFGEQFCGACGETSELSKIEIGSIRCLLTARSASGAWRAWRHCY